MAAASAGALAAPGDLDPTFGAGGIVTTDVRAHDAAQAVVVQSDGKIVVAGYESFVIARYATDGTLDSQFGDGGLVEINEFPGAFAATLQADGSIIVAGGLGILVRINRDGTIDRQIAPPVDIAKAVAVGPDGGIVAAGIRLLGFPPSFTFSPFLVRYDDDLTFLGQSNTLLAGTSTELTAVAIEPEGRIVAAGAGSGDFAMVRLNPDGTSDLGFGGGGVVTTPVSAGDDAVHAIALQRDGKIVAAGSAAGAVALARYDPDGTLDDTFGTGGIVTTSVAAGDAAGTALGIQPDGKLVVAGEADDGLVSTFLVAYYDANGALDPAFGAGGIVTTAIGSSDSGAAALALQPDGRIVVAGFAGGTDGTDFALARYEVPEFCGNGILGPGEDCDGGAANGTTACCTRSCTLRPLGETCRPPADGCDAAEHCDGDSSACPVDAPRPDGTPCDDHSLCTVIDTCTAGQCGGPALSCAVCESCNAVVGCIPTPQADCRKPTQPRSARLLMRAADADHQKRLEWKWLAGEQTTTEEFGDPVNTDDFTLCIYDESVSPPATLLHATAPAGGTCRGRPCWKLGKAGPRYRDRERTPGGIEVIVPQAGAAGRARIVLKGKGENLALPPPPLSLPLRVQLQGGNGRCWEATYSADQFQTNTSSQFSGKGD